MTIFPNSRSFTSNISKSPDRLLADVQVGGRDQVYEGGDGPPLNHSGRLIGRSGGDVGQSPGGLKLDGRKIHQSQEGHKLGDEAGADHLVNGRMFFAWQKFPGLKNRKVGAYNLAVDQNT